MKRFAKLFSLMIAALATFMVGFSSIYATEPAKTITVTANNQTQDGWWIHPFVSLVKYSKADGNYVFCLDSGLDVDLNVPLNIAPSLYSDKVESVNRIINKAINLGLGGTNQWSISDSDFYGVTQIAIWKAVHGEGQYGYTATFKNWIQSKGYQTILDTVYAGINEPIASSSVSLSGDSSLADDGSYLVSGKIKVNTSNVSSDAALTLSVSGGEVFVNDSWTSKDVTVKNGDTIMVRVKKPSNASGSVSATINVKSSQFTSGYKTAFYATATAGKQNIGAFVPNSVTVSANMKLSGSYENKIDLNVSKTDATGQKELAGADMVVYDLDGNKIDSWTSEEGKTHVLKDLDINKIYKIVETAAPEGYEKLTTEIYFKVNADGKAVTCKNDVVKSNGTCEAASESDILKIKNYPIKTVDLNVSKTEATGQKELAGADMVVYDLDGKKIDSWTSEEGKTHLLKGLDIDKIYMIIETAAPEGYEKLTTEIYFKVNADGKVATCKNDVVKANGACEVASESDILTIKNYPEKVKTTKVEITKKDISNGSEIEGAHLQIIDENGNIVDEWISTKEPHVIEGLEEGIYTLVETLPATNYNIEMIIDGVRTSRYEFEVTADGVTKIDVYNELNVIDVPNTGISASVIYIIGGLAISAGVGTVAIARRKENI